MVERAKINSKKTVPILKYGENGDLDPIKMEASELPPVNTFISAPNWK